MQSRKMLGWTKNAGHAGRYDFFFLYIVIVSLQTEGEFKITLCNTVIKLPVTLDRIKREALNNEFIRQTKTKICEKDQQSSDNSPLCNEALFLS